jgi:MFS family permease
MAGGKEKKDFPSFANSPACPSQETPRVTGAARNLVLICLASAGWAFHFGVGTQVIPHWLKNDTFLREPVFERQRDTIIGLIQATYYLGLGLTAMVVPWLMRRWGRIIPSSGMVVSGLTLALFPWGGSLAGWFGLRFVNGAAAGLSLIPLETLISRCSAKEQRTRNFGFYAVAITLSGALGLWGGLVFYYRCGSLAFYLGSITPLLGGLALEIWLNWPATEKEHSDAQTSIVSHHKFLSFGTAWSQGFLEGGMLAFLSFYLMSLKGGLGLSADTAGELMAVLTVGVILFQVPVSWLADRLGKVPVLMACYAVVVFGLLVLPWLLPSLWLGVLLFIFGACSGALYPLGLSLLGEDIADHRLPRLYAWYMAMECFGSLLGAPAMGLGMDWWGESAMFGVGLAAILGVLAAWIALRALHQRRQLQPSPVPDTGSSPREAA